MFGEPQVTIWMWIKEVAPYLIWFLGPLIIGMIIYEVLLIIEENIRKTKINENRNIL